MLFLLLLFFFSLFQTHTSLTDDTCFAPFMYQKQQQQQQQICIILVCDGNCCAESLNLILTNCERCRANDSILFPHVIGMLIHSSPSVSCVWVLVGRWYRLNCMGVAIPCCCYPFLVYKFNYSQLKPIRILRTRELKTHIHIHTHMIIKSLKRKEKN